MNADILKILIESKISVALGGRNIHPLGDKIWGAIAEAIVEHIQSSAVVNVVVETTGGPGTGIGNVT